MGVIKMKVFCLLCLVFSVSVASREAGRKPRLFLVSTSSTTMTMKTASVCYVPKETPPVKVCDGRRKRAIQEVEDLEDKMVEPSRSGLETNFESSNDRMGRFFLYWITTTSISTTTTYTATYSVTGVECTPASASKC